MVAGPGGSRLLELEDVTKRKFFFVGKDGVHLDHFVVLEQGTLAKVAPKAAVEEGQELDLKPGEVGLYDPQAGVAKLDGVDVCIGGAAKLVGRKVKARITAVMDGVAYAELVRGASDGDEPITAEAEAERPTRARRPAGAKKAEADVEAEEAEAGEPLEAEVEEDEVTSADGGEAPAKKKTRRGTRGGRNRKKKPPAEGAPAGEVESQADAEPQSVAEAPAEDEAQPEPELEPEPEPEPERDGAPAAPVIHLPDRDLGHEDESFDGASSGNGDAPQPEKKKTRRGTRGGRNRRKKPAAATATVEEDAPEHAAEAEPAEAERTETPAAETPPVESTPARAPAAESGGDGWEYTPMSEWDLDDDRG